MAADVLIPVEARLDISVGEKNVVATDSPQRPSSRSSPIRPSSRRRSCEDRGGPRGPAPNGDIQISIRPISRQSLGEQESPQTRSPDQPSSKPPFVGRPNSSKGRTNWRVLGQDAEDFSLSGTASSFTSQQRPTSRTARRENEEMPAQKETSSEDALKKSRITLVQVGARRRDGSSSVPVPVLCEPPELCEVSITKNGGEETIEDDEEELGPQPALWRMNSVLYTMEKLEGDRQRSRNLHDMVARDIAFVAMLSPKSPAHMRREDLSRPEDHRSASVHENVPDPVSKVPENTAVNTADDGISRICPAPSNICESPAENTVTKGCIGLEVDDGLVVERHDSNDGKNGNPPNQNNLKEQVLADLASKGILESKGIVESKPPSKKSKKSGRKMPPSCDDLDEDRQVSDDELNVFIEELFNGFASIQLLARKLLNNPDLHMFFRNLMDPGSYNSRITAAVDKAYSEEIERQMDTSFRFDLSRSEAKRGLAFKSFQVLLWSNAVLSRQMTRSLTKSRFEEYAGCADAMQGG